MKNWYDIQDKGDDAQIFLYDTIGDFGVSADQFVRDLTGLKANTISLFVNSPGGEVFGAMSMYNALKRHPANVHATIDGIAASSASFIVQAADRITMGEGSTMMIHEPHGAVGGNAGEHQKVASVLDKMGDTIADIYAGRAGGTTSEWRERMRDETWYRAEEAVAVGLADEAATVKVAALAGRVFNLAQFSHTPDWLTNDLEGVDLSVIKKSAVLASPTPDLGALMERYSLRKAVTGSTGGGTHA